MGRQPFYGTGWVPGAAGHGPVSYSGPPPHDQGNQGWYQNQQGPPPPNYNASNAGYYGQQSGVEMQPPTGAYQPQHGQPGGPVYNAPSGPPPVKA